MAKFQPKNYDIPLPTDINKMTKDQLNEAIARYGHRENMRLLRLEKYIAKTGDKLAQPGLDVAKTLAGFHAPHDASGKAQRFNIAPSKDFQEARTRLKYIIKASNFDTATVTGTKKLANTKRLRMQKMLGLPELSYDDFIKLTEVLEASRDNSFTDSDAILNIFRKTQTTGAKFETTGDFIEFIKQTQQHPSAILENEYEKLEKGRTVFWDAKNERFSYRDNAQ